MKRGISRLTKKEQHQKRWMEEENEITTNFILREKETKETIFVKNLLVFAVNINFFFLENLFHKLIISFFNCIKKLFS